MQTQQTNKAENKPANDMGRLPRDPDAALKSLIKITQNLAHLAEREHHALTMNDMMNFAIMQDEKYITSERYAALAADFRKRLEEFRGVDQNLLNRLESSQNKLAEQGRANNKLIQGMTGRARQTTNNTLFSAQELAQKHHVEFPQKKAQINEDNYAG